MPAGHGRCSLIALLYLGEHAAVTALVRVEPATPAARTMPPKEERSFDALLARLDAERKEDQERARRIAATHIDPLARELDFHVDVPFCDAWMYRELREQRAARARAGEEIGRALERWISTRPASGPSPSATAMLQR